MRMIRSPGVISWLAKRPVPVPGTGRGKVWLTSGRGGGGDILGEGEKGKGMKVVFSVRVVCR